MVFELDVVLRGGWFGSPASFFWSFDRILSFVVFSLGSWCWAGVGFRLGFSRAILAVVGLARGSVIGCGCRVLLMLVRVV